MPYKIVLHLCIWRINCTKVNMRGSPYFVQAMRSPRCSGACLSLMTSEWPSIEKCPWSGRFVSVSTRLDTSALCMVPASCKGPFLPTRSPNSQRSGMSGPQSRYNSSATDTWPEQQYIVETLIHVFNKIKTNMQNSKRYSCWISV